MANKTVKKKKNSPKKTLIKKKAVKNMSIFLDLKVLDLNTISKKNIIDYFDNYNKNYDNLIYEYFSTDTKSKEYKFILVDQLNKIRNNINQIN